MTSDTTYYRKTLREIDEVKKAQADLVASNEDIFERYEAAKELDDTVAKSPGF